VSFFAIPQPCNAQHDFIFKFFWDPQAPEEQGIEFFSPPYASHIDTLCSCELCCALSTLGKSAAMEDRNELFLEYRQRDRTADYCFWLEYDLL
jgi:hypothetical protein